MSIVNTNYNVITTNKFDVSLKAREVKKNNDYGAENSIESSTSGSTVSTANENAASSNVKNAQMASEIAYFSRLQAISGIEGYGNFKSGNAAAKIIPISLPEFDRTF